MDEFWRFPYMVESYRQHPDGVSDPRHAKFRTLPEAIGYADIEGQDGAFVTVYWLDESAEPIEVTSEPTETNGKPS